MDQKSPQWKKPSDVMKLRTKRLKRSRSEDLRTSTSQGATAESSTSDSSQPSSSQGAKRNPFTASQEERSKRICRRHSFISDRTSASQQPVASGSGSRLIGGLRRAEKPVVDLADIIGDEDIVIEDEIPMARPKPLKKPAVSKRNQMRELLLAQLRQEEREACLQELQSSQTQKPEPTYLATLPTDWSLKLKMRVTCEESLDCAGQLKSRDEALSIKQHLSPTILPGVEDNKKADFHSCCMYWLHPALPWLRLFPRMTSDKFHKSDQVALTDGVRKSLRKTWCEAFSSAYQLVRCGHCPYFYLCAHHLTVVFRATGVAGQRDLHALVTPTTRGFRENLQREGVEFSMPHLKSKPNPPKKPVHTESASQESGSEEEEDLTGEAAAKWLEDLGLNKANFPALSPDMVQLQREGFKQVDRRPESLVLVEGCHVQGLFNYLHNCRSCTPASGPQAGIPPTILAPAPFQGGTLISNWVRTSAAKETLKNGKFRQVEVLEISGPILPHHTLRLASRLCQQGKAPLTFSYNTYEPTLPFNLPLPENNTPAPENFAANWNMPPELQEALGTEAKFEKNSALREVKWSEAGFLLS